MSNWLFSRTGQPEPDANWEARLQATARAFDYPPTPDLVGKVKERLAAGESRLKSGFQYPRPVNWASQRWVWVAVILLLLLGGLLAVPQVRAAVLEFLQLGAIRIFLAEPTPTPTPTATPSISTPSGRQLTATPAPPTPSPIPSPTPLTSVLGLAGETSLAEAQEQLNFSIRLPTYPEGLGPPDRVFLQDFGGPMLVLVWLEPDHPDQVYLSLHQLAPGVYGEKGEPRLIQETTVHGQRALWTTGPYVLQFIHNGRVEYDFRRLVQGNVLLWVEEEITYRLETDLPLEEAVRVAESLK